MRRGRSFSEACDAALELARERELEAMAPALRQAHDDRGDPDELNEHGEYEDQASLEERGRAAVDSIRSKLLGCRRFFLQEICLDPEKRAAWDLLCGPADWEQAAAFEAQPDEAGHPMNFREPDMVTTVASGWLDSSLQRLPGAEEQLLKRIDRMYTAAKEPRFERQTIVPFRQNRPEPFGGEAECPSENDDPNAMHVRAEDEGAASEAVAEWQRHVDAGRIGPKTRE
jgi:hypothetical protein